MRRCADASSLANKVSIVENKAYTAARQRPSRPPHPPVLLVWPRMLVMEGRSFGRSVASRENSDAMMR